MTTPDLEPGRSPAPEERASHVEHADPYVRSPVSAYTLECQLRTLAELPQARDGSRVWLKDDVRLSPGDGQLLPLTLGALRTALAAIAETDSWLLPRTPVFYTDGQGDVHIDFPGLAGYTVESSGALTARAVNPF